MDANHKFLFERRPITQVHIEMLKSCGIEVGRRIAWIPRQQANTGVFGSIMKPFGLVKGPVAS